MPAIPLIRLAAMLPKGTLFVPEPPSPPTPGGADGTTNEGGAVVVNEEGDAPIGGD